MNVNSTTIPTVALQQPFPAGLPQQPIIVNNHIYNTAPEKPKEQVKETEAWYTPGKKTYIALNLLVSASMGLANVEINGIKQKLYQTVYLTGIAAGTAFALYSANKGKSISTLEKYAASYAKSNLTNKVTHLIENIIAPGPGAMWLLNYASAAEDFSAGSLVAGYWGYHTGIEVGDLIHRKLFAAKNEVKEIKA